MQGTNSNDIFHIKLCVHISLPLVLSSTGVYIVPHTGGVQKIRVKLQDPSPSHTDFVQVKVVLLQKENTLVSLE